MRSMDGMRNSSSRGAVQTLCMGLLCLAAFSASLFGGVIPGRWEKLAAQEPGLPIRLTLGSGQEMTGIFQEVTPDALSIIEVGGAQRMVPKSSVSRVQTRFKVPDRVDNGIAIGAGVGAIWGAAAQGAGEFNRGGTIVLMSLLGAGVGYLVDRARETPETLYRSR